MVLSVYACAAKLLPVHFQGGRNDLEGGSRVTASGPGLAWPPRHHGPAVGHGSEVEDSCLTEHL